MIPGPIVDVPLPNYHQRGNGGVFLYTTDQLRAYGDACAKEAFEKAAQTAEHYTMAEKIAQLAMQNPVSHALNLCRTIATSIRELTSTQRT